MAWPTTKAGTTHVDAGSDSPASARADIKQNIDNVNSIIDEFDIASPTNGDILQYSSSSGHWDSVASSSIGAGANLASLTMAGGTYENVSGNIYRRTVTVNFDPNSFITTTDNFQFTLGAGNYIVQANGHVNNPDDNEVPVTIYDETGASELGTLAEYREIGTVGDGHMDGQLGFTLSTQSNISFRQDTATIANRNINLKLVIHKF